MKGWSFLCYLLLENELLQEGVISAYFCSRTAKKVALFGEFAVLQRGLSVRIIFFFILAGPRFCWLYAVGVAAGYAIIVAQKSLNIPFSLLR